jgi:hypothetical protein
MAVTQNYHAVYKFKAQDIIIIKNRDLNVTEIVAFGGIGPIKTAGFNSSADFQWSCPS